MAAYIRSVAHVSGHWNIYFSSFILCVLILFVAFHVRQHNVYTTEYTLYIFYLKITHEQASTVFF